jgi:hypothetical protein
MLSTSYTWFYVFFKGLMAWYVVYRGKQPGVYATWARCNAQVTGFKNNSYKSFPTKEEAEASYLEFMGCEDAAMDKKVFVKPACMASGNQSRPKIPCLLVVALVRSFLLMVLVFFIAKHYWRCL